MHFLWICRRLGQKPAEFANIVRKLKQNDSVEVGKHKVIPLLIKNTPDGRLYILDLYEDGKLIRRSPCFLDQPRRGRNVRMVSEIVGIMLLVGLSITGAAIAYFFGSGLADTLMTQESCEILRFDVFDVDERNIYYVVEVQNTGTRSKEFSMHMKVEGGSRTASRAVGAGHRTGKYCRIWVACLERHGGFWQSGKQKIRLPGRSIFY